MGWADGGVQLHASRSPVVARYEHTLVCRPSIGTTPTRRTRTFFPIHAAQRRLQRRSLLYRYSRGPKMTAFHTMMLSWHGEPEMPSGASVARRLKSRMSRLFAAVDCGG